MTWTDKYQLAMSEQLTVKEMILLREIGQTRAQKNREQVLKFCYENDIKIYGKCVPKEIVFLIIGYDLDYYYQKMIDEAIFLDIKDAAKKGSSSILKNYRSRKKTSMKLRNQEMLSVIVILI